MPNEIRPDNVYDVSMVNAANASMVGSGPLTIEADGMDPPVLALAVAVGILRPVNTTEKVYELNPDWFSNPIEKTGAAFKANGKALSDLLAQVLGEIGGNVLGIPVKNPNTLGLWFPINNPKTGAPTGLYIVSQSVDTDTPTAADALTRIFGLGVMHSWALGKTTGGTADYAVLSHGATAENLGVAADVVVRAYGILPVVKVGDGKFDLTFGQAGYPLVLGADLASENGDPLFDENNISMGGVRVTCSLDPMADGQKVDMGVTVLQLQLPTDTAPKDRTLTELANLTGEELLTTVASLAFSGLTTLIGTTEDQSQRLANLLPVLGLSPIVPGTDRRLPVLRWDSFVDDLLHSQNPTRPFTTYFATLLNNSQQMADWMSCFATLLGMGDTQVPVTGKGTRQDPWLVPLYTLDNIGTLSMSCATTVLDDGGRMFYPGVRVDSQQIALTNADPVAGPVVTAQAYGEIGAFAVTAVNPDISANLLPSLSATITVRDADKANPLFAGTIDGNTYSFGYFEGGVSVGLASNGATVMPTFALYNVNTPANEYDILDLTKPGEVANTAKAELMSLINAELNSLFGLSGEAPATSGPKRVSAAAASLLGIIPPASATLAGEEWPADLPPPFLPENLLANLMNPVAGLSDYWAKVAAGETQVGDKAAFVYMFTEVATLINQVTSGTQATVTGDGTQQTPWRAAIGSDTLPIDAIAYLTPQDDSSKVLTIGLALHTEAKLSENITVQFPLTIEAVALTFVDTTLQHVEAFPLLQGTIAIPQSLTAPAVNGVSVGVDKVSLGAQWSPASGWGFEAIIGQPSLTVDAQTMPVGQDLVLTDTSSLDDLITESGATFAPIATGLAGAASLKAGNRAGIALDTWLGLLPMKAWAPQGVAWPDDMPVLAPTGFTQPIADVKKQLDAVVAAPDAFKAASQILAWAMGDAAQAPTLQGDGSAASPYILPAPMNIPATPDLALWNATHALGCGVIKNHVKMFDAAKLQITTTVRGDVGQFALDDQAVSGFTPTFSVISTLARTDGTPLINNALGSVDQVRFGVCLTLPGIGTDQVQVAPVLTLVNAKLDASATGADITYHNLTTDTGDYSNVFYLLVNEALQTFITPIADDAEFQAVYDVMAGLGLVIARDPATPDQKLGINPGGWRALLASPETWLQTGFGNVLTNPQSRQGVVTVIEWVTGWQVPALSPTLLTGLWGMGLCMDAAAGYAPIPSAWLALFTNPPHYIAAALRHLASDDGTEKRVALVSAITEGHEVAHYGPLKFQCANGKTLFVGIDPEEDWAPVAHVAVAGGVTFDIEHLAIAGYGRISLPDVGAGIQTNMNIARPDAGGDYAATITAAATFNLRDEPGPSPIQFWPFDQATFVAQVQTVVPQFAISQFVQRVFDPYVLDEPLAQVAFTALGIAEKEDTGTYRTKSLLGLFDDPVQWLLGDAVLGLNGHLNIPKIGQTLAAMPDVTTQWGIGLKQVGTETDAGVQIYGLPYKLVIDMRVDSQRNQFAITPSAPDGIALGTVGTLKPLCFGITLDETAQAGVIADGMLAITSPNVAVQAGYSGDAGLYLTFGQVQADAGQPLSPALHVFPFQGWESLILEAAGGAAQIAQQQLTDLLHKLLTKLKEQPDLTAKITAIEHLGSAIDVGTLVSNLIAANQAGLEAHHTTDDILKALEAACMDWLWDRLSPDHANDTAGAVAELLVALGVSGVSAQGGTVVYRPSAAFPAQVYLGVRDNAIGVWADADITLFERIQFGLTQAGVGIPYQKESHAFQAPEFALAAFTKAIVVQGEGPRLDFGYDAATKAFTCGLDPLGPKDNSESPVYLELLPKLFGLDSPTQQSVMAALEAWLLQVLVQVVPRFASIAALNATPVKGWLETPLWVDATDASKKGPSPLTLLKASQIVVTEKTSQDQDVYVANSWQNLKKLTPESFTALFLHELLSTKMQLLKLPNGGSVSVGPDPKAADSGVGIEVNLPNIVIKQLPNMTFQLGAEDKKWITSTGANADDYSPGMGVYVPIHVDADKPEDSTITFKDLSMALVNIGVDFHGRGNLPLVNMTRFQLGGVEPRGLIRFEFGKDNVVSDWGGGVLLDSMGISLAPTSSLANSTNPVAENLLGADSSGDTTNSATTTNPAFSALGAYMHDHGLGVDLYDANGNPSPEVWLAVQRAFGPLYTNKVGFGYEESDQDGFIGDALFDGSISLGGLTVSLMDLSVGVPFEHITDFSKYKLDLQGLGIAYSAGVTSLTGALDKQDENGILSYTGLAMLKAASFNVLAMGSYATVPLHADAPDGDKATSLFVFGNMDIPIGGPPYFQVEGVAAGFGYNRDLLVPDADNLMRFPLVQGAMSSSVFGGKDADPSSALQVLGDAVPPRIGQYWMAAGIKVGSCKMLSIFGMVIAKFGKTLEIDLVGVGTASFPPAPAGKNPLALAYVELGLVASFKPDEGEASVTAQLTPNSFLLYKDCKLTGGFAAKVWFGNNPNAGQFVVTLGGYHPAFTPPDYYPLVPQLGFNWPINAAIGSLSIHGGCYFALTPASIMAGGQLVAEFNMGPLKAWFDAGANFLIGWEPFVYAADVHVSVGAQFSTKVFGCRVTLRASIGALLELWGPPTAGRVKVDWFVISFTIPIGSSAKPQPAAIEWQDFSDRFLPADAPLQTDEAQTIPSTSTDGANVLATAPEPEKVQQVVKANIANGQQGTDAHLGFVVRGGALAIEVITQIPANTIGLYGHDAPLNGKVIGIQPMNATDVTAPLNVQICRVQENGQPGAPIAFDKDAVVMRGNTQGASAALWKNAPFSTTIPAADPVADSLMGAVLSFQPEAIYREIGPIDLGNIKYAVGPNQPFPFDWATAYQAPAPLDQKDQYKVLKATIMAADVVQNRSSVLLALQNHNLPIVNTAPDMTVIASFADLIYQAPPLLVHLGHNLISLPKAKQTLQVTPLTAEELTKKKPDLKKPVVEYVSHYRTTGRPVLDGILPAQTAGKFYQQQGAALRAIQQKSASRMAPLAAGSSMKLRLDPRRGHVLSLAFAGAQPKSSKLAAHAIVLGENGTVAAMHRLKSSKLKVAAGAAGVVIHRLDDVQGKMAGFDKHASLQSIAPRVFMGQGCVVTIKSPLVNAIGKHLPVGHVVNGKALIAQNVVRAGDNLRAGMFEVRFSQSPQQVVVYLKPESSAPQAALESTDGQVIALKAAKAIKKPNGIAYVFDVGHISKGATLFRFRLQSTATDLLGVWADPADLESKANDHLGLSQFGDVRIPDMKALPDLAKRRKALATTGLDLRKVWGVNKAAPQLKTQNGKPMRQQPMVYPVVTQDGL